MFTIVSLPFLSICLLWILRKFRQDADLRDDDDHSQLFDDRRQEVSDAEKKYTGVSSDKNKWKGITEENTIMDCFDVGFQILSKTFVFSLLFPPFLTKLNGRNGIWPWDRRGFRCFPWLSGCVLSYSTKRKGIMWSTEYGNLFFSVLTIGLGGNVCVSVTRLLVFSSNGPLNYSNQSCRLIVPSAKHNGYGRMHIALYFSSDRLILSHQIREESFPIASRITWPWRPCPPRLPANSSRIVLDQSWQLRRGDQRASPAGKRRFCVQEAAARKPSRKQ